jgi:hypothetical protein
MDYDKLSEEFDELLSKVTKSDYEKWYYGNKFHEVLNNMTDSDWDNWMTNRASKKEIRRLKMIEKADKQRIKISMENGITKDESDSIAKAIYEMQMLGLNVINSEEIKLTEELDKLNKPEK